MPPDNTVLILTLRVAVPLRIAELQQLPGHLRADQVQRWAATAVEPVGSRGDALMFQTKKAGAAAEVFSHMARGLAALAHASGGVLFGGIHWCVEHPMGISCMSIADLTCFRAGYDSEPIPAPQQRGVETVATSVLDGEGDYPPCGWCEHGGDESTEGVN